jgi:hypothetical protein
MATISQRARSVHAPDSFRRLINGSDTAPRTSRSSISKKRTLESPYDSDEARKLAEDLMRGKNPKILSAPGVSDVIHELTKIQVQALEDGDYRRVDSVRTVIVGLRRNYRLKDRLDFHDSRLVLLRGKLAEAQGRLIETQKLYFFVLIPAGKRGKSHCARISRGRRRSSMRGT